MSKYTHITAYTDGSCLGNPGFGGWSVVFVGNNNKEIETISGASEGTTTNNIMELTAAIMALQHCIIGGRFESDKITIYSDSKYVCQGVTNWIAKWKHNNWLTSGKTPVKNKDFWEKLSSLNDVLNANWHWVKAHDNNYWNNKADECARKMAKMSEEGRPLW